MSTSPSRNRVGGGRQSRLARAVLGVLLSFASCSLPNYEFREDESPSGDAHCSDRAVNDGETDVDCGGGCAPCVVGKSCLRAEDCEVRSCVAGRCQRPECNDGVLSPGETAIDCGGESCS